MTVLFAVLNCLAIWSDWVPMNREATVAYDVDCHALHIAISPWKLYLDLGDDNRAWRIARSWFNV